MVVKYSKIITTTNPVTKVSVTAVVEVGGADNEIAITTLEGIYPTIKEFEDSLENAIQAVEVEKDVGALFNFFPMTLPDAYALYEALKEAIETTKCSKTTRARGIEFKDKNISINEAVSIETFDTVAKVLRDRGLSTSEIVDLMITAAAESFQKAIIEDDNWRGEFDPAEDFTFIKLMLADLWIRKIHMNKKIGHECAMYVFTKYVELTNVAEKESKIYREVLKMHHQDALMKLG